MTAFADWSYSIHVRDTWEDAWVSFPGATLICQRISRNCVGEIESAAFKYLTGDIAASGSSVVGGANVFPHTGKWIKVTPNYFGAKPWVGYVLRPDETPFAASDVAGTLTIMGCDFDFIAVCPKYFMDRDQITTTVYYGEDEALDPAPVRTKRAIGFNMGIAGDERDVASAERGNRHNEYVPFAAYGVSDYSVFCSDPGARLEWRATDIIEYLLVWQALRDQDYNPAPFPIAISATFPNTSLAAFYPILPTEGRSVLSLINAILNPSNGYVWWLEYNATDDNFELLASTVVGSAVALPGSAALEAAASLVTLDFDTDSRVEGRAKVGNARNKHYHRVRVRGSRRTATFSAGRADGLLLEHWKSEIETEYKEANSETDAKAADAFRKADKFAPVYTRFRLDPSWSGESYDGTAAGISTWEYACPEIVPGSSAITGQAPLNIPGMRFMHTTLLKEGWDYTDATAPVNNDPTATAPELMRPLAYAKHVDNNYYALDKTSGQGDPPLKHSYTLHVLKGVPGVELRPSGGLNHSLAKGEFSTEDVGTAPSKVLPEIDPDTLAVTVTAEWDEYCEGTYPEGDITDVPLQELVVDIGERARWDYLAVGTVFDVNGDTAPKRCTTGGSLRDDRDMCRQLAKSIFQWFAEDRQTLEVNYNQVLAPVWLGDFINTFGSADTSRTASCTVTQIIHDLESGKTTILGGIEDVEFPGGLS